MRLKAKETIRNGQDGWGHEEVERGSERASGAWEAWEEWK
jgi:hypothetical protein